MIEWCSYCQRFQGERPPFDRFELSHGVCEACARRGAMLDPDAAAAARPVAELFRGVRVAARTGRPLLAADVLGRAEALGVRPVDLLVGMMQPALHEIGELWARGEVTVDVEHRFSAAVEELVAVLRAGTAEPPPGARCGARFLLVNADGNYHTLGVRIVELMLRWAGCQVTAVVPGLPVADVVYAVQELRPEVLGVSVAMLPEMRAVGELGAALESVAPDHRPRLVVGGRLVKAGLSPDAAGKYDLIADPASLVREAAG